MIEQTFALCEVNDVDANRSFHCVPHSEHEPLESICAVRVVANPHIKDFKLSLTHLLNVGALKTSVKFYEFRAADFDIFTFKNQLLVLRNVGCGRNWHNCLLS